MTTADLLQSEEQFLNTVTAYAEATGWRWTHFRPGRTADSWRTAVQGSSGFPDLVLVRNGRLILTELKSQRGRVSQEQQAWGDALKLVPGVEYYLWRPESWPEIEEVLA
jgi:hypothetical protein